MASEYIDDTLDGSGQYPTKIPGYADAADIQEALRLYHYGSNIIPTTSLDINPKSIAGYIKQLQTNIDNSEVDQSLLAGVGIDWNSGSEQFDIDSTVATKSYVANSTSIVTKVSSFTLELADASKTILLSTASPMTLTIPSNSSVAIPVGYQYNLLEIGSGRTTLSPGSGVIVGSKNSQLFLDGQYSKGTLLKIATDTWIFYGDVYEAANTPVPAPVAPAPVAPAPVAPAPVAPAPVAPAPVAPAPVAPSPVTPVVTPVTPSPVTPVVTPVTPVATVTCGPCEAYTTTAPTCNGEDSYVGNYSGTRQTCSDGSYVICTQPTFTSFGDCIATQASGCGGTNTNGPCSALGTWTATGCYNGVAYAGAANTEEGALADLYAQVPNATNVSTTDQEPVTLPNCSTGTMYYGCCANGLGVSGTYADANTAVLAFGEICAGDESFNYLQGGVSTTPSSCNPPAPVAPAPVAPAPVAPAPVAPAPVAPAPVAPAPVAPNACVVCPEYPSATNAGCAACTNCVNGGGYWTGTSCAT